MSDDTIHIGQFASTTITGDVQGASFSITNGKRIAHDIDGISWSASYQAISNPSSEVFFV